MVFQFYLILSVANLIPHDPRTFFPLTRYVAASSIVDLTLTFNSEGNFTQVRMAAFDALFLMKWYTPKIMRYILAVMACDSSRAVRRHVARNACHSLALLVSMGEMKTPKDSESVLIEEDGNAPEKAKENKKSDMDLMIKTLRKDREIGKNEVIREFLLPIAMCVFLYSSAFSVDPEKLCAGLPMPTMKYGGVC